MRTSIIVTMVIALMTSCSDHTHNNSSNLRESSIAGIQKAEKDFQQMTVKGIAEAFWFYADSNAVIKRENDTLISGRNAIRKYYSNPIYAQASVTWTPDFTDVSQDGDLGYTYGKYTWH